MLDIYETSLIFVPGMEKYAKYHKLEGRSYFQGLPISIENKVGSTRRGVSPEGKEWATTMSADYGYIRGTMGVDGDEIDVFVGPNHESTKVFVVHQLNPRTGAYDEDKCILGTNSKKEARKLFLKHYDSKKFLGEITELSMRELKATAARSKMRPGKLTLSRARRTKPKRLPSKEWERAFSSRYDQKKEASASQYNPRAEARPSGLGQDFTAGMDPFGVFTNAYGVEAQKAGMSEGQHRLKHGIGTLGGFIGGATVVPSSIMGVIGAAKGAAKSPGSRLAGAAKGFWEGFKTPVMAPIQAVVARGRVKDVVKRGYVEAADLPKIMPIAEHIRIPDAARATKESHLLYDTVKGLSDDIGRGVGADEALDAAIASAKKRGVSEKIMSEADADLLQRGSDVLRGRRDATLDDFLSATTSERAANVSHDAGPSNRKLKDFLSTGRYQLSDSEKELGQRAVGEIEIALAESLATLGLGGAVGAGGAFVQYGEGRKSRMAQEEEIARAVAAAKNRV